jgi:homoserine O-acetyltransferase/O-succinyltransferase
MPKAVSSPLGVVETQYFTFGGPGDELLLQSGQLFGPVTVAYQTYGQLNSAQDNAILICHALSGDSHVAGINAEDGRLGWWEVMVGPGLALDTNRYFFICANVLGGCKGSSGPASVNPATNQPYALSFPVVTLEDMVRVQKRLLDWLGVRRLLSVIGGSMGGMQALTWSALYPEMVVSAIPIATSSRLTAQGIAWDEIGRKAIMADANWDSGNYYAPGHPRPEAGLAVARMVGHITYLSEESMEAKFGRRLRHRDKYSYSFDVDFEVESYLAHQGEIFNRRFDANSYLYITRAMDYFDLTNGTGNLAETFARTKAHYLLISFSSDWLYPPQQSQMMVDALHEAGRGEAVEYFPAISPYGHDAFLLEAEQQAPIIANFLDRMRRSL